MKFQLNLLNEILFFFLYQSALFIAAAKENVEIVKILSNIEKIDINTIKI